MCATELVVGRQQQKRRRLDVSGAAAAAVAGADGADSGDDDDEDEGVCGSQLLPAAGTVRNPRPQSRHVTWSI